jgi:hypothetical protein
VDESFPGAFDQWQIALPPAEHLFEDFNDQFVILGQKPGCDPLLFCCPISDSALWGSQGHFGTSGRARPLLHSDLLSPGHLPCHVSRGPRLGGFLHPFFYGVAGNHFQGDMKSHQPHHVPTSIFSGDDMIVTQCCSTACF